MPNWVTNKIEAPAHVIQALLNNDGHIDFSKVLGFAGTKFESDGIYVSAEQLAESVCRVPLSKNPLIAALQEQSRSQINIQMLRDDEFEQFIGMLKNYRACGYLHSMDFARKVWGTKWNACESVVSDDRCAAQFETAWNCPEPVLIALSKLFPLDTISVVYADEDIGSNCGNFKLLNGSKVFEDIAPPWREMNDEQQKKWQAFAYQVTGHDPEQDEDDEP